MKSFYLRILRLKAENKQFHAIIQEEQIFSLSQVPLKRIV